MSWDKVTFEIVELNFQLNKIEFWEKFFLRLNIQTFLTHSPSFFYPSLRYWYSQRNRPTVYYSNVFEQLLCCHILHNKYTNIRYQYWLSLFLWLFLCSLASFINWQDRENCCVSLSLYPSQKVNIKWLYFRLNLDFYIEAWSV